MNRPDALTAAMMHIAARAAELSEPMQVALVAIANGDQPKMHHMTRKALVSRGYITQSKPGRYEATPSGALLAAHCSPEAATEPEPDVATEVAAQAEPPAWAYSLDTLHLHPAVFEVCPDGFVNLDETYATDGGHGQSSFMPEDLDDAVEMLQSVALRAYRTPGEQLAPAHEGPTVPRDYVLAVMNNALQARNDTWGDGCANRRAAQDRYIKAANEHAVALKAYKNARA